MSKGGGMITERSIEQVLERSDLVEIVSAHTELQQRGAEHLGRCPFHDERSPSFWVNSSKGVYHCFGCGASGDTISYLQAKQGLSFVEAIEYLADRFRVDLEYDGSKKKSANHGSKRKLFELMDDAAAFFERLLWSSKDAAFVRDYLKSRSVSAETARAFRLGYSPQASNTLASKALTKGYTHEQLSEARLVGSRGQDFFRERLMVPIIDRAGRVQAFGARKLKDEQYGGKYINSADGPLFHKKQTLFLAPDCVEAARRSGRIIVVEGYMDVIALWQAGIKEVCAVMGTALGEQQVLELKRLAPQALFAFDPDAAGQIATLKALEQAQNNDLDVRVVLLPDGEDPADLLAGSDGKNRMDHLLDHGVSLLHFRVNMLLGSGDMRDMSVRERVYHEAVKLLKNAVDGPERREQIMRVAAVLELDTEGRQAMVGAVGANKPLRITKSKQLATAGASKRISSTAVMREKRLLAVALRLSEMKVDTSIAEMMPSPDAFSVSSHARVCEALVKGDLESLSAVQVREDSELFPLIAELSTIMEKDLMNKEDADVLQAALGELAQAVELQFVERRINTIKQELSASDFDEGLIKEAQQLEVKRRSLQPNRSGLLRD